MLHSIMKQHETVAVDFAIGNFQIGRLDSTGKKRNSRSDYYRIQLHNHLVNLRKKSCRSSPTTAEPDVFTRFFFQFPNKCNRIVRNKLNILIRTGFHSARKYILLQAGIRISYTNI